MFLLVWTTLAFANPWLIKAPQANPHEYAVYLQNSNFEKISTVFLACDGKNKLKEISQKAQIEFLEGDLEKAHNFYLEIVEQKWSCDWNESERPLISFAFFRLAQLENNTDKQAQWLEQALHFDDTYAPDVSLFPPPLLELAKQLRRQHPKVRILLPEIVKKFSAILRNGKFISLSQLSLEERPGVARYTLLSETYQSEKVFVSLKELETLSLSPQVLVAGDCEHPQVDPSLAAFGKVSVFFGIDCIKEVTSPQNTNSSTVTANKMAMPSSLLTENISSEMPAEEESKSWLRRNALWLGAVVVSSLAVNHYIQSQKQDQYVPVPTTTLHTQNSQ